MLPFFCCFCLYAQEKTETINKDHKIEILRPKLHLFSHVVIPTSIAWIMNSGNNWEGTALTYGLTNLVDLDHVLAKPVYDPDRCSINYHPLHSEYLIIGYSLLALNQQTKDIGTGLLIHMGLDYIDCEMMKKNNLIQTGTFNMYTISHFLFWYGIGKYSDLKTDEMFSISMVWEASELKLPFKFAKEGWMNKSVDLIANYLGFVSGRNG